MKRNSKRNMTWILFWTERLYPTIISAVVTWLMWHKKVNFIDDPNIASVAGGILSVDAIIIGFLGAILPTVLGMRKDSAFVKYVFKADKKNLFREYVMAVLMTGIIVIVCSILIMFENSFQGTKLHEIIFYLWFFLIVLFLLCTYRCISNMLRIAFSEDKEVIEAIKPDNDIDTEMEEFNQEISKKENKSSKK